MVPPLKMIENSLSLMKIDDVVYGIPLDQMANVVFYNKLVSKKFVSFKKPMNPSKFQTHPAVLELFALCAIPAVSLKGRKNTSANNA